MKMKLSTMMKFIIGSAIMSAHYNEINQTMMNYGKGKPIPKNYLKKNLKQKSPQRRKRR